MHRTFLLPMTAALGLLAASAVPAPAAAAPSDDFDVIRSRWVAYLSAADLPAGDPATAAAFAKTDALVEETLKLQRPDGTWDGDMRGQPSNNAEIWPIIYHRMRPLAQAWVAPNSKHYHDPVVLDSLVHGLNGHLPGLETNAKERPGNWWIWDIGCPMDLGSVLLVAGDALPPEVRTRTVAVLTALLRLDGDELPTAGVLNHKLNGKNSAGPMTGQNAIWVNMARMRLGLLTRNADLIRTTAQDIAKVCARLPRQDKYHEGVTPDGSYLIHGPQIMWSYGAGQVADTGLATMLLSGTSLAMPPAAVAFQEDLLLDSAAWCSTKFVMHPMLVGRDYSRSSGAPRAGGLLTGALFLALSDGPRHTECAALAKEWLADSTQVGGVSDTVLGLVARVKALPGEPSPGMDGCRAFPDGDFLSIQRHGWGAGLKMYSNRTWPYEIVNQEGLTSRHNSDGTLFLITKTTDWQQPAVAALDWKHLPGATISPEQFADKWTQPGETAFVGSIADGRNAVAAQDLKSKELRAHKSWLVFDNAIVCLGSGIVSPTAADTVVAQTPITKDDADFALDGKPVTETPEGGARPEPVKGVHWAVAGEAAYLFPEPDAPLFVRRQTRVGIPRTLNANGSDKPLAPVTFAELFLPHGTPGADAPGRYAYIILPKQGAEDVRKLMASPAAGTIKILAHDEKVHAAQAGFNGNGAAVFWEAGMAGDLQVDAPCIALWKHAANGTPTVTVTDPTHAARTIKLTWKGRGEKSVEVKDGRPASVTF